MCIKKTQWEKSVDFHGHACIGLALGYRVAEAALRAFGQKRAEDEEMVAIVENDSCAVDAIQVITGCTVGKGNMILRDFGKQAYTFALRDLNKAIRITIISHAGEKHEALPALRQKVLAGDASAEEKDLFQKINDELLKDYLTRPLEEVCKVAEIDYDLPQKARIFPSVTCSCCDEKVMEPRARLKSGKPACIPCAEKYDRGWGNI
ncbi:MAG: TraR/DksA C4-type zinc finger protein [Dethiobacter sp.]|jgi:formylmethanofuran dehydrogenase subunit E|nr:TraR/DksA C4-type zinc finger protein [Dethiobacter sp.]MBS3989705.1 TraR/DksA C4-type zinc finger protein [Dethiobacter sp.]